MEKSRRNGKKRKSFGEIGKSRTSGKGKLLRKLETKVGRSFFGEFLENKWEKWKKKKSFWRNYKSPESLSLLALLAQRTLIRLTEYFKEISLRYLIRYCTLTEYFKEISC